MFAATILDSALARKISMDKNFVSILTNAPETKTLIQNYLKSTLKMHLKSIYIFIHLAPILTMQQNISISYQKKKVKVDKAFEDH
ncbi:hypothetical protein BpHYR1_020259 [Brachionus plicatilis]|uniref:Uncharacterized protein n=1 Tax=Brachionus plicatilis TaxID=10195 RepID=A0A3M7QKJ1_BRAPC|nr:hypothetical protein BpHYR1_020259 [Brachionus plicatilis]